MSTAVQIVTEAYRKHNLDEVTSFATTQEFPYNLANSLINDVITKMNRLGSFWFTETKTQLAHSEGTYTWNLNTLAIDPKKIRFIQMEATDHWGELVPYSFRQFQNWYRRASIPTQKPTAWTYHANTLELNYKPDQDYSIYVYHFKDMPKVTAVSDTFLIPEADEDILIDNCYEMLGFYLGRWDEARALAVIEAKTQPLLADMKKDRGIPRQMPRAF